MKEDMNEDTRLLPTIVGALIILLVAKNLAFRIVRYLRLKHIPGPVGAGWTRLWLLRQAAGGKSHLAFFEVTKKYGVFLFLFPLK
jgi:hypothetical protein